MLPIPKVTVLTTYYVLGQEQRVACDSFALERCCLQSQHSDYYANAEKIYYNIFCVFKQTYVEFFVMFVNRQLLIILLQYSLLTDLY